MHFLLDAQLPRQLTIQLVSRGHQASHVFDHLDPQADDREVAETANRLGACVMTKDADFAELAIRGQLVHTLVWIRVPNVANDVLWARVERALPAIVAAARNQERIVEVF
jgi:predicted nuclease of predicted toxin-antitoxin system